MTAVAAYVPLPKRKARRTEPFGMRVRWSTATGAVGQMIAARAVTGDFGLIVLVARPQGRMARKFRSSILKDLWRVTSAPLFVVNETRIRLNGSNLAPPKTLFVPCPSNSSAEAAFPYLDVIAPPSETRVVFLRRRDDDSEPDENLQRDSLSGNAVDDAAELLRRRDVDAVVEDVDEDLDLAVAARQAEEPGSWIVMGSHMRHGIRRSVFGSMADRVVRIAPGPVMIVPTRRVARRRSKRLHSESLAPPRGV